MINFDKEELLKLAKFSCLKLDEQEIVPLLKQIKAVLAYTEELNEVQISVESESIKNVNLFREDRVIPTNSQDILNQAPKKKDTYFVVPKILN
ncbi:Asp-tRNA(Asn)/Glu-tRNA(Gln) amidotransferase subunit GatC [Candidatus Babeliales bacterium]|nr:Asp-tRNA(Asn)/Glu-tRNA(Gln) amidotransferase subunit GatC [Candidatus Babeliales bacterium]MCF7899316.1 Asp-tRNA(Asn)/Glu-tRNA(Gln) amidotransferase subunit GatC [Candidatus Babeliales bacterium]